MQTALYMHHKAHQAEIDRPKQKVPDDTPKKHGMNETKKNINQGQQLYSTTPTWPRSSAERDTRENQQIDQQQIRTSTYCVRNT